MKNERLFDRGTGGSMEESSVAAHARQVFPSRMDDSRLDSVLRRRPFYVIGEVVNPGTYPYQPDLSVMAAVIAAGGFTHRAHRNSVRILHAGAKEEVAVPLDPETLVSPGDIIRIDGRPI